MCLNFKIAGFSPTLDWNVIFQILNCVQQNKILETDLFERMTYHQAKFQFILPEF